MSGPARPSLFVTDFPRGTQKPFSSPSEIFSADGEVCVHQCRATSIPDPGFPRVTSNTWVVIGGRRLATVDVAGFSFSVTSDDELSVEDPKFWFVLRSVGLVSFSTCMVSPSVIAEPNGHRIYSYLNTEMSDGQKFLFINGISKCKEECLKDGEKCILDNCEFTDMSFARRSSVIFCCSAAAICSSIIGRFRKRACGNTMQEANTEMWGTINIHIHSITNWTTVTYRRTPLKSMTQSFHLTHEPTGFLKDMNNNWGVGFIFVLAWGLHRCFQWDQVHSNLQFSWLAQRLVEIIAWKWVTFSSIST